MYKSSKFLAASNKLVCAFLILMYTRVSFAADVMVTINNTDEGVGKVYVALCREENFMKNRCDYEIVRSASEKATIVSFNHVEAGDYAISAFYDLNGNGDLDTSFFGAPKEPNAVSNNARGNNAAPEFDAARITLSNKQKLAIEIDLF